MSIYIVRRKIFWFWKKEKVYFDTITAAISNVKNKEIVMVDEPITLTESLVTRRKGVIIKYSPKN